MSYNGWSNYETWCVHLWLSNDEGSYDTAREVCRGGNAWDAAQRLKDTVNEFMPDLGASMASDLLSAALSEVDWQEVAEAFREDNEDSEDEEDAA